ncbi:MAG: hypothetical protein HY320_07920 [Armatimonadetes bacterium]|nr:hypothetical protein [Armatimonadota bacterium]
MSDRLPDSHRPLVPSDRTRPAGPPDYVRVGMPSPPWWAVVIVLLLLAGAFFFGPHYYRTADYWKTFATGRTVVFVLSLVILVAILRARRGGRAFVRRIPGLTAIDEAVGRATEMGRPITFSLGLGGLDIITLQALAIALHVVRLAIRFGTRVILTTIDPTLYAVADEAVHEAYTAAGRPESFNRDDVRFLSDRQFAYASAMVGLMHREQVASNFMFGQFFAESLILAEAGNQVGAIQVAGTPTTTQIPFFVAACDYTIIGDEYYAATAYLTREPVLSGSLVGQDRAKMLLLAVILLGISLVTVLTLIGSPQSLQWVKDLAGLFTNAK